MSLAKSSHIYRLKNLFSIAILLVLMINSTALGLQHFYKAYLCEDAEEYLEIAGRKITVCGKVCSLEESEAQQHEAPIRSKTNYNTEIPPLFKSENSESINSLTEASIDHLSGSFCFYNFSVVNRLIKPPKLSA